MERLIPETVYEKLPNGVALDGLYSQVVKSSGTTQVHVAGTAPVNQAGELVGEGEMATQARTVIENVEKSLTAGGTDLSEVVRMTIYTTDVDRYVEHGVSEIKEAFDGVGMPTSTLVGVDRLASPEFLVEIEVTAVIE